jgi:membrane associated rhomboid family serine protease
MNFHNLKFIKQHPRINCPDCAIPMDPFSCREVVVDRCGNCKGVWFDKKELGIFRDSLKELPIDDIGIDKDSSSEVHTISTCPRCKTMLSEAAYGYNSKVVLKKCGNCEGFWLPQAELLKFIDLARIAKITEPDVKGAIKEWTKFNKDTENQKKFNQTMEQMNRHYPFMSLGRFLAIIVPLYDENPRSNKPWVTSVLMISAVITFFIVKHSFAGLGIVPGDFHASTLITSLFVHAGYGHLIGNLFFLWTFGDNVEDVLGPAKYFCYFLICGMSAGLLHVMLNFSSLIPAVGASGAISGLMGGYLYLFPWVSIKTWVNGAIISIPAWIYLGFWFLLQLVSTFLTHGKPFVNVAFAAHVGGFFMGYVLVWLLVKLQMLKRPLA